MGIMDRDQELDNLRRQVVELQHNLSETFSENQRLNDTVNQQKVAILSLQTAVDERRRSETRHKTVRLIYKDSSDISGDESETRSKFNNKMLTTTHQDPFSCL